MFTTIKKISVHYFMFRPLFLQNSLSLDLTISSRGPGKRVLSFLHRVCDEMILVIA